MWLSKVLLLSVGLAAVIFAGDVHCHEPNSENDVVDFALRYGRSVRATISVVVTDEDFFLDVVALAENLGGTADINGESVEVSFGTDELSLSTTSADSTLIVAQGRSFVSLRKLREMRPLRLDVSLADLTIYVASQQLLPIDRAGLARMRRSRLRSEALPISDADTVVGPENSLMGGATLNYRIWVQQALRTTTSGAMVRGGWALGFGTLDVDMQATLLYGRIGVDGLARWSYRSPLSNKLTMFDVGLLTDQRVSIRPILGIAISNAPASPLSIIGRRPFSLDLEEGQQADLYAGQRYLGTISDSLRNVMIPALLGTQYVTAEIYGSDGRSTSVRLPVRNDNMAVPPGRIVYDLTIGRELESETIEGRTGLWYSFFSGMVSWLAMRSRLHDHASTIVGEVGASVMLSASTNLRGAFNPGILASAALTSIGPAGSSLTMSAKFYTDRAFALAELTGDRPRSDMHRSSFSARAVWPFSGDVSGSVDIHGTADKFEYEDLRYSAALQASIATNGVSLSARLRSEFLGRTVIPIGTARIGLRLPDLPLIGWITNGLMVRGEVLSRFTNRAPIAATLGLSRAFRLAGVRLNATATSDVSSQLVQFSFEASRDIGDVAVQSSAAAVGSVFQAVGSVSGSMRFDETTREVTASRLTVAQSAGIAIRFFVDDNDDSQHQDDEEIVEGITLVVDGGTMRPDVGRGYVVITDLPRPAEFLVSVDASTIPDPTLAIRHLQYSIVTEAHRVRAIDIPLVRSSTVEGRLLSANGETVSVRGTTIIIDSPSLRQPRSVRAASDGSFAVAGLPPGLYKVTAPGFAQAEVRVVRGEGTVGVHLLQAQ